MKEKLLADAQANIRLIDAEVVQVVLMVERGGKVFGPHENAVSFGAETRPGIEPKGHFDGALDLEEAVALLAVHQETRLLFEMFHKGGEVQAKVRELISSCDAAYPEAVIKGMASFCQHLGDAAGVRDAIWKYFKVPADDMRERVMKGEGKPSGSTTLDAARKWWWDRVAVAMLDDGMKIRENVCSAVIDAVAQMASRRVRTISDVSRWSDEVKGARLAAWLYLAWE